MTDSEGETLAYEKDMTEFIREHKRALDKIRSVFKNQPITLGTGSDGTAFDIGGGRVLKIFGDKTSYEKAKEAVNYRKLKHCGLSFQVSYILDHSDLYGRRSLQRTTIG